MITPEGLVILLAVGIGGSGVSLLLIRRYGILKKKTSVREAIKVTWSDPKSFPAGEKVFQCPHCGQVLSMPEPFTMPLKSLEEIKGGYEGVQ